MVAHKGFKNKTNAKRYANKMNRKGFKASVYKSGNGFRVSVTR